MRRKLWAAGASSSRASWRDRLGGGLGLILVLLVSVAPVATAATMRFALPPGLQQTALICLAEAQRLCPDMLTAKDHGVACLLGKRRRLSQTCRTIADQAVSFLHGGDVHLDLRELRRHASHLKIPGLATAPAAPSAK